MWNGVFSPSMQKNITDHFDVINIQADEVLGIVYVTIVFHRSPNQQYVFEIPEDRFEADKESIGEEVLKQLRGEG